MATPTDSRTPPLPDAVRELAATVGTLAKLTVTSAFCLAWALYWTHVARLNYAVGDPIGAALSLVGMVLPPLAGLVLYVPAALGLRSPLAVLGVVDTDENG